MKKALIVLLLLALAGGLFAQGWTFTGSAEGGIGVFFIDGADDKLVMSLARDANQWGPRIDFNGAWENEAKNAGLSFKLRAQGGDWTANNSRDTFFDFGYGWLKAMDGLFTVYGGKVDNGTFNTADKIVDGDNGEGLGILAVVSPIDGLNIGVGAYANDDQLNGHQYKSTFNVAYTMPETFKVMASFMPANEIDGGTNSKALVSFGWLGTVGLHAAVTAEVVSLEKDFGDNGIMSFYETVGYDGIQNLSLNLGLRESIAQAGGDLALWAWFWASYAVMDGAIVPRLDVNFAMGSAVAMDTAGVGFKDPFKNGTIAYDNEYKYINVRPSVQFRIDPNCFFELGYMLNHDLGDQASLAGIGAPSGTNHGFYTNLKVSF